MNILDEIGMAAMMGQLAEECAELIQAAMKYQRIIMDKNPTPVTDKEALAMIKEEATDVRQILSILETAGMDVFDENQMIEKGRRWLKRIEEHKFKRLNKYFRITPLDFRSGSFYIKAPNIALALSELAYRGEDISTVGTIQEISKETFDSVQGGIKHE